MAWIKLATIALAVVKELLAYLREQRKCTTKHEQIVELKRMKTKIIAARNGHDKTISI